MEMVKALSSLQQRLTRVSGSWSVAEYNSLVSFYIRFLPKMMDVERCTIFLKEPGAESLFSMHGTGLESNVIEAPLDGSIVGRVMASGQSVIENDLLAKNRYHHEADEQTGFRSRNTLCTPMHNVSSNEVLGVIQILNRLGPDSFDEEKQKELEEIAGYLSISIESILLKKKIAKIAAEFDDEVARLEFDAVREGRFIAESPAMREVLNRVLVLRDTPVNVLIQGENGTGKELVAKMIHENAGKAGCPFVPVNCACLPEALIESEFFGHEKGAFTGAGARKIGRFEIADKGTIFLDEIGELPLNTQAKLLQVLQDGVFERVGGAQTIKTDVRIVAATNQDLQKMVREKKFREDLFFRLNIFPIHITPLRKRKEDIPVLGRYFINKYSTKLNRRRPSLNNDAIAMLMDYVWPGNVRELQNIIERLIILKSGQTITSEDLASVFNVTAESEEELMTLEAVEKKHLEKILGKTGGIISGPQGACKLLDLKRGTLLYRLKKLGIHPADFKNGAP